MTDWDKRFLNIAKEVSAWSKDPDAKVGAVIVSESRRILSIGYNGLPAAMPDTDEYLNSDNKLDYMIHAEMNSIYNAGLAGVSLKNSTIYVYGRQVCHECMKGLIQAGISNIVTYSTESSQKWQKSWEIAQNLAKFANIFIKNQ
jgi:dCMP deaminase